MELSRRLTGMILVYAIGYHSSLTSLHVSFVMRSISRMLSSPAIGMMFTGSCPDFAAHDNGTDVFLTGQAAFFYLLFQKTQLLCIEADWYHMVSFSHLFTYFPTGY